MRSLADSPIQFSFSFPFRRKILSTTATYPVALCLNEKYKFKRWLSDFSLWNKNFHSHNYIITIVLDALLYYVFENERTDHTDHNLNDSHIIIAAASAFRTKSR